MSLFGSISNFISSLAPVDNNTVTQILGKNLPSSSSSSSFPISQMLFSSKQQDQTGKPSLTRPSYNCQQMNSDSTRTQSSKQRQVNADNSPRQDNNIGNEQRAESNGVGQEDLFQTQHKQEHLNPRNLSEGGLETKSPKPPSSSSSSSISSPLPYTTPPFTSMQPQGLNVAPPISKPQEKAASVNRSVQMSISQSLSSSQLQMTSSKPREQPSSSQSAFSSTFPRGLLTAPSSSSALPSSSSAPQPSSSTSFSSSSVPARPSSGCLDELIPDLSFLSEKERRHIEEVMLRATAEHFNDSRRLSGCQDWTEDDPLPSESDEKLSKNVEVLLSEENPDTRCEIQSTEKEDKDEIDVPMQNTISPVEQINEATDEITIAMDGKVNERQIECPTVTQETIVGYLESAKKSPGNDSDTTESAESEGPDTPSSDGDEDGKDTYELNERGFYTLHHLRAEEELNKQTSEAQNVDEIDESRVQKLESTDDRQQPASCQTRPLIFEERNDAWKDVKIHDAHVTVPSAVTAHVTSAVTTSSRSSCQEGREDGTILKQEEFHENPEDRVQLDCCACCGRHQADRGGGSNAELSGKHGNGFVGGSIHMIACSTCTLNVCLDCVVEFTSIQDGDVQICRLCHDEALQVDSDSESDSESRSSDSVTITAIQSRDMEDSTHELFLCHEAFIKDETQDQDQSQMQLECDRLAGDKVRARWDYDACELDALSDVFAANVLSQVIDEVENTLLYETDSLGNLARRTPIAHARDNWNAEENWTTGSSESHQSPPSWCDWSTFDNPDNGIEPESVEREDFWHLEDRRSSDSSEESQESRRQITSEELRNKLQYFPTIDSEFDFDDGVAQKVTVVHFNRSDSAPCKSHKNRQPVEADYQRSHSVPKPSFTNLTSSFFAGSSFSVLSEGPENEESSLAFQDINESMDSRDGGNEVQPADDYKSESLEENKNRPPGEFLDNHKTPLKAQLSISPTQLSHEQSDRKPSPGLDNLYKSLFDNSDNPLSQLFQTSKTATSPEIARLDDVSRSLKSKTDSSDAEGPLTSQSSSHPAVTFTNPSFKKEVNLHLSNLTDAAASLADKLPFSMKTTTMTTLSDKLTTMSTGQTVISPSTFEKLLNEVREEENQREKSWSCNPLELIDPCVEDSRVFVIKKTQSRIEKLNGYDFDPEEDPLESAFKGFSNQLASLTNADSVEKKPVSVRSLEDFSSVWDENQSTVKMPKTFKFPLKSVKSVPAFVNPSFLFDRNATSSQSSEDIIGQKEPSEPENPYKQFQKSHSVIFPHASSASTVTPNFNWSSLNDLSVPLEKVLAELDQTLKPFVSSSDKLKASDGTSQGIGFMKRCPSYSNILSHPLLVDVDKGPPLSAKVEPDDDFVDMQASVDSSFAEVTATLQETTSELETLKFDLEHKTGDVVCKSPIVTIDEENILDDLKEITADNTDDHKDEADKVAQCTDKQMEIAKNETEINLVTKDAKEENTMIDEEKANNPESKEPKSSENVKLANPVQIDDERKKKTSNGSHHLTQNTEESSSEIRANKSKSEIMRLLSMSRYRDMSPEPIYLEGLKSPCLMEPELDELHFLSDEELREIDLDEDIPPKHLFQFSKKLQEKTETSSKEDYFKFPNADSLLHAETFDKKKFNYQQRFEENESEISDIKISVMSDKGSGQTTRRKLPPLPGLEMFSAGFRRHFDGDDDEGESIERKCESKSVKQTSRSLDLKEKSGTANQTLSLDETKLSHFSSSEQGIKAEIMNDKVAFPEALLERFLDLKNSLFGAAEKHVSFDKPHLQRRHSSMWKETKRKYSSVDENKFLQRSDSVNCKSAWSVRSFSLDLPESDDEMTQATEEANFWRHAKTIDQRPSHLFGFVPRNEEDSDDASKSELDKNYCKKLLIKSEEVSCLGRIEPKSEATDEPQLTKNLVKSVEQEPRKVEAGDAKPWQRLSREDSDDKETVDIFGLKILRSKHYLHQRVKDEIKIVTATKRLRIDEADEIRMMEAEMAVREKLRKARAQESSKTTPKAADLDDTLVTPYHKAEQWSHPKKSSPTSSFSQDLMNVLNDITELPLLSERKQSLISSVSSLTSSSQSVDGVDSHNYIDVGPSECDYYGYYDVPQRNSRSRSSTSCYSDSYAGVRGRKDTFESRSSQLIYAADDEEAIMESGVDFQTFGQRQSSYSLPGSRSTSMSRSINSGINEDSYYNNFDYYNKYDLDYDYIVRLQKEEQLKQEKLTKLRLEIEKRRKHLQEIMPRQHMVESWQGSTQYHHPPRPYYGMNMDWVVADNYGNAVPYELEECPGIIKPIDYQIKSQASRQRVNEYRELPNERYYDYHQNYGPYYDHLRNDIEQSEVRVEDQLMNSRRTPVDLSEILGMSSEQIAREKLNNQILKSRSPAKSPSSQIQNQNKKSYNGKAVQSRMYHRQVHQHLHHSSIHGSGKKSEQLTADTSDSEESLLQYCPVTCGSSRDSGVSSGEVVGEMFERSDPLATRSSSGDLLSIQTTPPPHYATGSRKRGGSTCRMGSNVLVDRRLIRQTNSLKNPNNGAAAGELYVKAEESTKRFLSSATPVCQFQNDPQQEKANYQEQSDYSLGSYSIDEDGAQSSGKAEMQHSTPDKLKSIQAKKYKFPTKRILLTADLNEKKFKENGFGLNILGGQKVGWDGNERIKGALVVSIQPGSIADQLNKELQEGDEILEWNGECLRGRSAAEVEEIIEESNNCEVELVIKCLSLNSIRADLDQRSTTVSTICTLNSNLSVPTGTDSFEDQEAKHGGRGRFKESSSRESCSDNRSEPKSSPKSSSPQTKLSGRRRKSPNHHHPCPASQTSLESFTNDILALKQVQHEFRKNSLGEIQLQLSYDDFDGTLNVHVIQARNLLPKIKIGYSDPLVKVFLLPYASSTENKRKTKCVPRTLHPEWHQTLIFMHIRREDLPEKTLEVSVWDHDHFLPDQLLGEVLLDLSDISYLDNRPHWYPLMEDCDNRYGRRPRTSTASSSSESGGDTSSSGEPDNKHLEERRDKKRSNQKDSSANNSVSSGNKKRSHKSRRADNEGHLDCQQHVETEVFKKETDQKQRRVCDDKDEKIETWSPEKHETESEPSQTRTKDTHITWTDKRDSRINTIVFEKNSHGVQKSNNQHFVGYMRRTFNVVWSSVACCSRSDSILKRKQYSSYRNEPQENEVLV